MAVPLIDPEPQRLAPAPSPADVGVVMAMPMEAGHLIDKLARVRRYAARGLTVVEGELEGRILAVLASGVGAASARRGVEHLLAGHRPQVIVSAGFAGALDPALNRNDLIAPRSLIDGSGEVVEIAAGLVGPVPGIRSVGRLLLVDHVVTSAAEKARLRNEHQADLIDMETFAAAVAARERRVPFLSLRVVSDDARTDLPPEVGRLLNTSGSYRVGAALRALVGRPSSLKDFWSLHAHALEAADRLADGLQVFLRGLT
ncbi:phosphorylase family protein [Paludisphaera soli]|uniref:phosphorylase family protein n=1 Tax=Paludisphaera soli TaxID=2712865 RepID=UPI001F1106F2|nr:nucleoside phosphorylase [Paludisphaera soli]